MKKASVANPHYSPAKLLDVLEWRLGLKNDAALSRALEVDPAIISKVRSRRLHVSASLLIRMHEVSGMGIRELRTLMGDLREHTGPSATHPPLEAADDESDRRFAAHALPWPAAPVPPQPRLGN